LRDDIIIMSGYNYVAGVQERVMILRTDGTPDGTTFLSTEMRPGCRVSPIALNDDAFVLVVQGGGKNVDRTTCVGELYKTDGNSLDFVTSIDLDPVSSPTANCSVPALVPFGAKNGQQMILYTSDTNGIKIWTTDGTADGTFLLDHLYPGQAVIPKYGTKTKDDNMFLIVEPQPGESADIWVIDFAQGISQIVGQLPAQIGRLVRFSPPFDKNSFLFGAQVNDTQIELWRMDLPLLPTLLPTPDKKPTRDTATAPTTTVGSSAAYCCCSSSFQVAVATVPIAIMVLFRYF